MIQWTLLLLSVARPCELEQADRKFNPRNYTHSHPPLRHIPPAVPPELPLKMQLLEQSIRDRTNRNPRTYP